MTLRTVPTGPVTEAEFQQQVVELAGIAGWQHLHVRRTIGRGRKWTTSTNLAGWPDLLLWRPGRVVAAELKAEKGKTTPEQEQVLASLAEAGVETHVWRPSDWDDIAAVLGGRQKARTLVQMCAEVARLRAVNRAAVAAVEAGNEALEQALARINELEGT